MTKFINFLNTLYFIKILNNIFFSPIQLTKLAISHLVKQKGCVVNVSSVLAKTPNFAAHYYSTTKAALEHYSKAEALNLAAIGVRVNCVS